MDLVLIDHVREFLERDLREANPDYLQKLIELAQIAYDGADDTTWQDLGERFQRATGLDEAAVARLFGAGEPAMATAPKPRAAPRPPFEEIVGTTGWFAKYLEWTAESEPPAQFHFAAAMTGIAAGMGRRPLLGWSAKPTYPNLYTLLVGPSGARKSTAIERAVGVTRLALDTNVLPNEGTHQGYAHALRRISMATGSATGLIASSEFAVLAKEDRNKQALLEWLTDWYDSPAYWTRALRGEEVPYELNYVCLSIIGGSHMPGLRTLPMSAVTSGFFPRWWMVDASGKRHWHPDPRFNERLEAELIRDLKLARERGIPEALPLAADTRDFVNSWYLTELKSQYESTQDEEFHRWLDRKQSLLLKVATVWQFADGAPMDELYVEWAARARKVINWSDETVARVYGGLGVSREGEIVGDVLRAVVKAGGRLAEKKLIRGLRNKYTAPRIREAVWTLRSGGELVKEQNPIEGIVWKTGEE